MPNCQLVPVVPKSHTHIARLTSHLEALDTLYGKMGESYMIQKLHFCTFDKFPFKVINVMLS